MHYEKLENGDLLISATVESEQKVIDKLIETFDAYRATFSVLKMKKSDVEHCMEDCNIE